MTYTKKTSKRTDSTKEFSGPCFISNGKVRVKIPPSLFWRDINKFSIDGTLLITPEYTEIRLSDKKKSS